MNLDMNLDRIKSVMSFFKGSTEQGYRALQNKIEMVKKKKEFEKDKSTLLSDNGPSLEPLAEKFSGHVSQVIEEGTIGLSSVHEFAKKRRKIGQLLVDNEECEEAKPIKKRKQNINTKVLSFADDDEEEEDVPEFKIGKDPSVNTVFLPDRKREEEKQSLRDGLRREWEEEQERIKEEEMSITYSYWDGIGHRRSAKVKKGMSIGRFLENVQNEFKELRRTGSENLMFVKEDMIIPAHYTFYELIITKARGKSGPLFEFEAKTDVRIMNDASIEKRDSHAAKIVDRRWYEMNRHIFPASRWEVYDPSKKHDKYTVR